MGHHALKALRVAGLAVCLALVALVGEAWGQFSPGRLSRPHAELDRNDRCLDCHRPGHGVDPARCLTCHQALGERVGRGEGLHAGEDFQSCERCHIDHQGREFKLIYWGQEGREAFDHGPTGWPLTGAHGEAACRNCHRPDRLVDAARLTDGGADPETTFLGLDTACASCHEDVHRGQLAPRGCTDCHSTDAWRPAAGFDHATTPFPLTGAHRELACGRCHASETTAEGAALTRFAGLGTACADCHRDPHAGRLGNRCASCHGTGSWDRVPRSAFDHDRTAYPLTGRHAAVACDDCHRPGQPLSIARHDRCTTCHGDAHAGQLTLAGSPPACESCHSVDGFRPARFSVADHEQTAYPLTGAHRQVTCERCHTPVAPVTLEREGLRLSFSGRRPARLTRLRFASTACRSCHDDPHRGQVDTFLAAAGCASCHAVESWRQVRFEHSATRFPLRGAHRDLACARCHADPPAGALRSAAAAGGDRIAPVTASPRPTRTAAAHAASHAAGGRTVPGSAAARTAATAAGGRSLSGSTSARTPAAATRTGATPDTAGPRPMLAAGAGTQAATINARAALASADGHREMHFAGVPRDCAGCHADPHRGQFLRGAEPRSCEACHGEESWAPVGFDHRRDTAFGIEGAHRAVACFTCHPTTVDNGQRFTRYRGVSRLCVDCHTQGVPPR